MSLDDILSWIKEYPCTIPVEITGGEPLQQDAVYPLMQNLINSGRQVLLETNGSLSLRGVPEQASIIMDVKCPGSGMAENNMPENITLLQERRQRGGKDEIKFVLSSVADFHWARAMVEDKHLDQFATVLFSPVCPVFHPAMLARLLLDYRLNVRLQLQLHTQLWPGQTRGV